MSPRADRGTPEGRLKAQEDSKRHYYRNKEQYLARNRKKRATLSDFLRKYKEFHGCSDCGSKFPYYVMDFDHRDPSQKVFEPARLTRQGSWDKMIEEIAKCDVVCANCHRERTHQRGHDSYRTTPTEDDFAPDELGSSLFPETGGESDDI